MRVFVISFGKLRTPGLREASDHYLKLLGGFVEAEEVELKPLAVPDKSATSRKLIQEKEGSLLLERLDKLLTPRGRVMLLEEGGRELSTLQWAHSVGEWEASATPAVAFCVGSSLGFSDPVRARSKAILSLGRQTLPHELARVVLYEQLYRAWSVTRGHPYHNEGS